MTTLCIDELSRKLKSCWGWSGHHDHVPPGPGIMARELSSGRGDTHAAPCIAPRLCHVFSRAASADVSITTIGADANGPGACCDRTRTAGEFQRSGDRG